ncbi:cytidylyltransferase domain-containing protein [Gillisia sp. JM1]|uniref:acylneuraminate cytidylyltransferase family protein n=1 Tax=Gillisia sp. JM1 TaxID=1283286 RepID=UPI00047CFCF2|nr:hypothetical protein [Gillisia sp. JM1]
MSISLFLPVRAGSERVKNKNMRSFAGIKNGVFELKLNQLENLHSVDEVIISSNDSKCLEIAETYKNRIENLVIDERPDHLGSSSTKLEDLILHVAHLSSCENILWTHATNPLFTAQNYMNAIEVYLHQKKNGFDSLVSGHIIKDFLLDKESNRIVNNTSNLKWPRTQDLTDLFAINNAVFIANRERYLLGERLGIKPYYLEIDKISSLDIDYEEDFLIAEAVYEKLKR